MFDCAKDVLAYHDEEVTLPQRERTQMRDRRDANRDRLTKGLEQNDKPAPEEFHSQGSYSMKTMTQYPNNGYDVDDGVYFAKEDLVGPRGGELTALDVRQMVRDALDDGTFKTPPALHTNCVRVDYQAGYHVDVAVYRRVVTKDWAGSETEHFELASSDWKRSDARDVTAWFDEQNIQQSPDDVNGRQLRRVTRLIKKFARSRKSWDGPILSGFGITKLVTESYVGNAGREDQSLYDTMKAIHDRLTVNLVIWHPVTPNETITSGTDDSKARFFKEKLADALEWLSPLFEPDCTRAKALKCWDQVFSTAFFSDRAASEQKTAATVTHAVPSTVLTSGLLKSAGSAVGSQEAVQKRGDTRYA